MKPHNWIITKVTNVLDTEIHNQKLSLEDIQELNKRAPRPGNRVVWVECSGCGAVVTASEGDLDRAHVGWRMPEDCYETIVEGIMEE
jgi:hypothetical protein